MKINRILSNEILKNMCSDTAFLKDQLIQPIFIKESNENSNSIIGLGKNKLFNLNDALKRIEKDLKKECRNFLLFPVQNEKFENDFNVSFTEKTITNIKETFGSDIFLWIDLCICSLTKSGHCCIFTNEKIDINESLKCMTKIASSYANSGVDGIAPSSMTPGIVKNVRSMLDKKNKEDTPIMSYSSKFASNFYGPFREAANSAPQFGDRKQYQLDVRSKESAIASSISYAKEGADLLMVKPGLTSIDLISDIHTKTKKPVGAYHVSGEYAGIEILSQKKLLNFDAAMSEVWDAFKRAGAQFIISYAARDANRIYFNA